MLVLAVRLPCVAALSLNTKALNGTQFEAWFFKGTITKHANLWSLEHYDFGVVESVKSALPAKGKTGKAPPFHAFQELGEETRAKIAKIGNLNTRRSGNRGW